ncbi:MAG: hypothetical protein RMJ84_03885 [Sandaracinaceae bacterium]|nr:hypothetical protein [Sandaracinaceae bacterium]
MKRDFTYIDDIVEGVIRIADRPAQPNPLWNSEHPDPSTSHAPYRIYNIGNHTPIDLDHLVSILENALGRKAIRRHLPMQPGDVPATYADVSDLEAAIGFRPSTPIEAGI